MAEHEHSDPDFHDEEDGKLFVLNAWIVKRSEILWMSFEVCFVVAYPTRESVSCSSRYPRFQHICKSFWF